MTFSTLIFVATFCATFQHVTSNAPRDSQKDRPQDAQGAGLKPQLKGPMDSMDRNLTAMLNEVRFPCGAGFVVARVSVCCNDKVKAIVQGRTLCCGDETYNPENSICCNNRLSNRMPGLACCGDTTMFNTQSDICCDNKLMKLSVNTGCCGGRPFNGADDMCCGGRLVKKGISTTCCGIQAYPAMSPYAACCGNKQVYNPKFEFCCKNRQSMLNLLRNNCR